MVFNFTGPWNLYKSGLRFLTDAQQGQISDAASKIKKSLLLNHRKDFVSTTCILVTILIRIIS